MLQTERTERKKRDFKKKFNKSMKRKMKSMIREARKKEEEEADDERERIHIERIKEKEALLPQATVKRMTNRHLITAPPEE